VVGSRGLTGIERFFLGSVARRVAKLCPRPVLVARALRSQLREAIVATDGSEHAAHAVRFAASLPLPEGAQITLIHVVRPQHSFRLPLQSPDHEHKIAEMQQKQEAIGRELLVSAQEILAIPGQPAGTDLRVGDPAAEILRLAEERSADLIVAGARGVSLIEGLLMGSVADRLLKHAPCSVLIVP
jgi:nucleotide-binding universal stress UspA family protein